MVELFDISVLSRVELLLHEADFIESGFPFSIILETEMHGTRSAMVKEHTTKT